MLDIASMHLKNAAITTNIPEHSSIPITSFLGSYALARVDPSVEFQVANLLNPIDLESYKHGNWDPNENNIASIWRYQKPFSVFKQ
jgi:hypothetical protein